MSSQTTLPSRDVRFLDEIRIEVAGTNYRKPPMSEPTMEFSTIG